MRLQGRKLRIGPVTFSVTRRSEGNNYGEIDLRKQTVYISPTLKDDMQAVTVAHEAIHGILELGQYNAESMNEQLVDCLAVGIVGLLRDNPWMRELIYGNE